MDYFYEQFVGKNYGDKQRNFEALGQGLLIVAVMISIIRGLLFGAVVAIVYIALEIIARKIFLEYEYELTEEQLVITKIMNKKKRKIITKLNVNEIVDIRMVDEQLKQGTTLIKASFDDGKLRQHLLYVNNKSKLIAYKVSMDSKMITRCKRINNLVFRNI